MTLVERLRGLLATTRMDEAAPAEQYLAPFQKMARWQEAEVRGFVTDLVDWAIRALGGKNSRIVWFMRWAKLAVFSRYGALDLYARERDRLARASGLTPEAVDAAVPVNLGEFRQKLEHFYNPVTLRNLPRIREYTLQYQTPDEVISTFDAWEQEAAQNPTLDLKKLIADDDLYDEDVEIEYPNGWIVARLHRNVCRQYGEAMGHCGTPSDPTEGGTFVVLRRPVWVAGGQAVDPKAVSDATLFWYPLLFFELDGEGYYRQMKGRHNSKPDPKLHYPYVVDMLTLPYVKGIAKGSWYDSSNDLKFDELEPRFQEMVWERNPEFEEEHFIMNPVLVVYDKEGLSPRFFDVLAKETGSYGELIPTGTHPEHGEPTFHKSLFYVDPDPMPLAEFFRKGYFWLPREAEAILNALADDEAGFEDDEVGYFQDYFQGEYDAWATPERMADLFVEAVRRRPDLWPVVVRGVRRHYGPEAPTQTPEALAAFLVNPTGRTDFADILREAVAYGYGMGKGVSDDFIDLVLYLRHRCGGLFGWLTIDEPEGPATVQDFLNAPVRYVIDMDKVVNEANEMDYDGDTDTLFRWIKYTGGLREYDSDNARGGYADWQDFIKYKVYGKDRPQGQGGGYYDFLLEEKEEIAWRYGRGAMPPREDVQLGFDGEPVEPGENFHVDRAVALFYNRVMQMGEAKESLASGLARLVERLK